MEPPRISWFGEWSYAIVLLPYYMLLAVLAWRYRLIWRYEKWWFFIGVASLLLGLLGLLFEWIAGLFGVWEFPQSSHLVKVRIPIFGWVTGHRVPIEELLWIFGVIPLFYYLYLWATLVFFDIIYVVDEQGRLHKREERWVGFFGDTHIKERPKGRRGQEFEQTRWTRHPGFVACACRRLRKKR